MASTPEIADVHDWANQLIPWLVNGTLEGEDAARLRAHLAECPRCRDDLDAERHVYESVRDDGPIVFVGEPSLQKLMARIEADDFALRSTGAGAGAGAGAAAAASPIAGTELRPAMSGQTPGAQRSPFGRRDRWRPPRRSAMVIRWLAAAVVVEALGLGLGAWMWQGSAAGAAIHAGASAFPASAAPYRTLTSPAPRFGLGARVRVVFRTDLSLDGLQALLQRVGAHIVDGPTDAHVYTLGFAEPLSSAGELDARITTLRADPHVLFAEPAGDRPP